MDRSLRLRSFGFAAIVLYCLLYLVPTFVDSERIPSWFFFDHKITLGLDLQGGAQFTYSIALDKAVDDKAAEIRRDVEAELAEKKIEGAASTPDIAPGAIAITLKDPAKKDEVQKLVASRYGDIITTMSCPAQGPLKDSLCLRISSSFADGIKKSALKQAVGTIKKRIDARGVSEPTVIEKDDQIIVELPGLDKDNIARIKELIARTAKLEFKIVADGSPWMSGLYQHVVKPDPAAEALGITALPDAWAHEKSGKEFFDSYLKAYDRDESFTVDEAKKSGCWRRDLPEKDGKVRCKVTGRRVIERYLEELAAANPQFHVPPDGQIGFELVFPDSVGEKADKRPYWRTYYLDRAVRLTGSAISKADVSYDPNTLRPEVAVEFNRLGARAFGDLTGANVGRKMAIILDDVVASAPTIQSAIRQGRSSITMGGSDPRTQERDALDLVNVLRTGSLPAPLEEQQVAELGPTLGRDAVDKAQLSFGLGIILVVIMMIGVYRWSGTIAIVTVVINIMMMLAVMAMFRATLTLPGIAAVVLTVGMAVDGNVLIYERIREELNLGKSVKGAVEVGFQRAFSSILDGQLTTAVAGWVLLQYGSGPIYGFAVMLLVGIATTLFTNVLITRFFFDLYVSKKKGELATISI
ncbi:MAG: protein translocase subunit SecD [Deltaproteobacteria bacterium]|nr:protein translocase subunit SecD [Kofleriaceae bacterium]